MKIDTVNKNCNAKKSIPVRFTKACIRFYQVVISPLFPQSCRYYPTCSEYSIQAVEKYGICKGFLKSFLRILKCNPFAKGGFDPV